MRAAEVLLPEWERGLWDESLSSISWTVNLPTNTMEKAQKLFMTFVDQWSTGCNARIQFHCESGRLKVELQADLGYWKAQGRNLNKASPCRARRRERRAAERDFAAAEEVAAAKAAAEEAAAAKATVELVAAKAPAQKATAKAAAMEVNAKTADEELAAKAAAEKAAANAAAEEAAVKTAAEEVSAKAAAEEVTAKAAAEKAAAKAAAEEVAPKSAAKEAASQADAECAASTAEMLVSDQATTSGKNSQYICWNFNREMTKNHQCDEVSKVTPPGPTQNCAASPSKTDPVSPCSPVSRLPSRQTEISAPYVIKGKIRMLDGSPICRPKR